MTHLHVCRDCGAVVEPEARSAEALARRVEELEETLARYAGAIEGRPPTKAARRRGVTHQLDIGEIAGRGL